jgi:hypothetical protein
MAVKSSRELLASSGAADPEIGSVAHIQTFTLEEMKTGTKREQTSLTICVTASTGGKRQLVEMAEVMSDC